MVFDFLPTRFFFNQVYIFIEWVKLHVSKTASQGPVVQKLDSAIHRISLYPVDNAIGFPNTYPMDSDLSGG